MEITNALVERVSCSPNSGGSILVNYNSSSNRPPQSLQINLSPNTLVLNNFGQRICVCCIQPGMRINAVTSPITTRSIPPQTNALFILVLRSFRPPVAPPQPPATPFPPFPEGPGPAQPPSTVSIGEILMVNFPGQYFVAAPTYNQEDQTHYLVSRDTRFFTKQGRPIPFSALRPGEVAQITHASFQTASIPPQTPAYQVQLL